jgi:hypothetical protein
MELTPVEIEMVKIKREQEALAKKEAELKRKAALEKEIAEKMAHINKLLEKDRRQVKAAQDFCMALGVNLYSIVAKNIPGEWEITEYTNPTDPKSNDFEREVVWSHKTDRTVVHIERGSYKILVEEHIVYSSSWSRTGSSKGYKMYISGPGFDYADEKRGYSKAATVHERIEQAITREKMHAALVAKKKNALQNTVDMMQNKFPDATVTVGYGYVKNYNQKYTAGDRYDTAIVKFINGVSMEYRVYEDGSLGRANITFPKHDAWDLMETMSKMNFIDNQ